MKANGFGNLVTPANDQTMQEQNSNGAREGENAMLCVLTGTPAAFGCEWNETHGCAASKVESNG